MLADGSGAAYLVALSSCRFWQIWCGTLGRGVSSVLAHFIDDPAAIEPRGGIRHTRRGKPRQIGLAGRRPGAAQSGAPHPYPQCRRRCRTAPGSCLWAMARVSANGQTASRHRCTIPVAEATVLSTHPWSDPGSDTGRRCRNSIFISAMQKSLKMIQVKNSRIQQLRMSMPAGWPGNFLMSPTKAMPPSSCQMDGKNCLKFQFRWLNVLPTRILASSPNLRIGIQKRIHVVDLR